MNTFPRQRIVVIGATSSGKSTLAQTLAEKFNLDYIELDALFWEPNWKEADVQAFRERVRSATHSQVWVVAGNYHKVRDLIWPNAQTIIWLDYPLPTIFWRLLKRTIRRATSQKELWNGNRETFWGHLKIWSAESLFHWLFKTYWRRKREIPILFSMPEHQHLHIIHFKHPWETEDWLASI